MNASSAVTCLGQTQTQVVSSAKVRSGQEALPYREPISMNSQFLWMRDAAWFSKPLANGALRRGWVMAPAVSEASVTAALGLTIDVVSSLPPVRNMPLVCSRCIFMCATTNATMNDLAQLTQILRNRFILVSRLLHWTQADVLFFAACVWVGVKWAFYWGLSLANLHHVTARRALLPWNATGSCAGDKNRQRLNLQGWQHHEQQCWGRESSQGLTCRYHQATLVSDRPRARRRLEKLPSVYRVYHGWLAACCWNVLHGRCMGLLKKINKRI